MGCVFLGRPLWANSARHDCATPFASAALVLTEQKEKTRCRDLETSLYSVSLLNDEQTPMEFVVHEEAFFDMDQRLRKRCSHPSPGNRGVRSLSLRTGEEKGC